MTEELYINGEAVDLKPDAATTLNYKSNLLGDISKITSSNSQTIQCPKTTRNRKIFDNPGAPAYVSDKRYNRYSARLVRNGIEIVRVGYAVLLSSSETYEIALYWGVMANFQAWVDKAAKLNELTGTEALTWGANITATSLSQMKSAGYGYAKYDCGVSNTSLVNIHPSVTAWWALNRIATQAGFTFEIPDKHKLALRGIAIPCLSQNASAASNQAEATVSTYPFLQNSNGFWGYSIAGNNGTDKHGVFDPDDNTKIRKVDGATKVIISIIDKSGSQLGMTLYSNDSGAFPSRVYVRATQYNDNSETTTQIAVSIGSSAVSSSTGMYAYQKTYYFADINEELLWGRYDYLRLFPHNGSGRIVGSRLGNTKLTITEDFESIIYPSTYPIPQNLPEISQIDYIKAICGMLGIFAVPDPANVNNLKFVSLDTLQENKVQACDWSDKLARSNDDEPKTTEYKINDYCRNNYFRYKEDDTVSTNADGNLKIDSEILDAEKTVITLPFAPSDGSTIRHYELNDDGTAVDAVQVKDRIMRLISDGSGLAMLTFDGLDFTTLLSKYYSTLSRLLNGVITIAEQVMLDEYDLKSLDYSIPFYLRQYGKFYGIVSIQSTANKACEVKAIQLPETVLEQTEPERPSQTVYIGWEQNLAAVYITASKPPASDLEVVATPYTYEGVALGQEVITLAAGQTKASTSPVTRIFGWLEINSITPEYDDTYSYEIAEQTQTE
ncbi:hypothetical protein [Alistipes finegoldii]|uniref:hypothetical protein n=1 Tax=Alistipes finegoldii TaxID=214856 RepID=UPI003AB19F98